MEKEGIPFLTRQLSRQPSPITLGLRRLSSSFPKWVPPEALYADRRATAAYGLGLMGPPAATAVTALESLKATASEEYIRRTATFALMRIRQEPLAPCIAKLNDTTAADWYENVNLIKLFGSEALAAIPTLIQTLETTNRIDSLILAHICEALGRIHRRPEVCVPALVPFLKSPDLTLRQQAVLALKQFGPAAQPARAALLECLKDPDPWIVTNSAWILEQIDSNPAARSGSN